MLREKKIKGDKRHGIGSCCSSAPPPSRGAKKENARATESLEPCEWDLRETLMLSRAAPVARTGHFPALLFINSKRQTMFHCCAALRMYNN